MFRNVKIFAKEKDNYLKAKNTSLSENFFYFLKILLITLPISIGVFFIAWFLILIRQITFLC